LPEVHESDVVEVPFAESVTGLTVKGWQLRPAGTLSLSVTVPAKF